ncbi:hypothetical protein R83H12_00542 [Fibrobacteria bacterium R8-3-H12]
MSMKNLVIIILLLFTFSFTKSFKDLWHCKTTCISYIGKCNYDSNISIYIKHIDSQYSSTICYQYKGDKEYCTKIIDEFEKIDSEGEVVVICQGETISYGFNFDDGRLYLIYKDHTVGHYECVREFDVK